MSNPSSSQVQPTLLFIPDISGFTQFVNDTEVSHSQHIIEELLESLIDANEIGLNVSEIEGDAILFYRTGPAPTAAELLAQVQRMYVRFYGHLRRYDTHRICQCGACSTASGLKLKFVAHYGEVSHNQIKEHSKLFGKDVIVAHRLLKNDVSYDEYALLTHDLVNACSNWVEVRQASWADPAEGEGEYDFGSITYCHIPLKALRAHVPEPTIEDYSLDNKVKVSETEALIEAPIDIVFDVISDLSARHVWQEGLVGSDRLSNKITQNGATHRCVIKNTEKDPFVVSHNFKAGKDYITFTDTERKQGWATIFTLRRIGAGTTRIEQHTFVKSRMMALVYKMMMLKKSLAAAKQSYENLNSYCKTLVKEGRRHPAQIVLEEAA